METNVTNKLLHVSKTINYNNGTSVEVPALLCTLAQAEDMLADYCNDPGVSSFMLTVVPRHEKVAGSE